VQFLHTRGAPCGIYVFSIAAAASNGHGSTLRWLREHGCPWNPAGICNLVAKGGSVEALELLLQQGIVLTAAQLTEMLNIAGAHSNLAAAQWLRAQGVEWPDMLVLWHAPWPRDMMAWASAEGCTSAHDYMNIDNW
jgi:hypothetical protein